MQGAHMQKIKLFANYSVPVIWGVVGLVVGCVAFYLPVAIMWERVVVKPENITPTDGLTVIILSVIAGVFIGAPHRTAGPSATKRPKIIAATCLDTPRSLPVN
jgi:hypothetical protein